jgi:hypothetical protein
MLESRAFTRSIQHVKRSTRQKLFDTVNSLPLAREHKKVTTVEGFQPRIGYAVYDHPGIDERDNRIICAC